VTLAVSTAPARSSYVDTLRALAIVRVYLHHTLWISWLTTLFPSMWVMFALAGLLTARSIDRGGARRTVRARFRRALPPLWGLAIVAVPLMLLQGWPRDQASPLNWPDLLYWIVPLANPPTSSWAGAFALGLWYLRAYLWFVLLSPMLLWAFRRWPISTLITPLLVAMLIKSPIASLPTGRFSDVIDTVAIYGTAWILGFARHTGHLERISARVCGLAAAALAVGGLAWGLAAGSPDGWPFSDQMAEALWGTAFVLVVLRWHPDMGWLRQRPGLEKAIAFLNSRAVTIYVWHLPVLFATGTLLGLVGVGTSGMNGRFAAMCLGAGLLAITVAATGWIEDLAARRRPAIPFLGLRTVAATPPATERTPAAAPVPHSRHALETAVRLAPPSQRIAMPGVAWRDAKADWEAIFHELGDLDDFFWPYTTWYRRPDEMVLVYHDIKTPTLTALSAPECADALTWLRHDELPPRSHAHITVGAETAPAEEFPAVAHGLQLKQTLIDPGPVSAPTSSPAPTRADLPHLLASYAIAYPANWLAPGMIDIGRYLGVRRDGILVAVAGVHVWSTVDRVAALGNGTTHPAVGGQGLGRVGVAAPSRQLLQTVDHIALNVKADNQAAISLYTALDFAAVGHYQEMPLGQTPSGADLHKLP
jgi:peptidoglycan/LPS O-acetylase OafA/YrhL